MPQQPHTIHLTMSNQPKKADDEWETIQTPTSPIDDDWEDVAPEEVTMNQAAQPEGSDLERLAMGLEPKKELTLWDRYNKPLTDYLPDEYNPSKIQAKRIEAESGVTPEDWNIPFTGGAKWKGLRQGLEQGAADAFSGLTTPSNLLPMLTGMGAYKTGLKGITEGAKLLNLTTRGLSGVAGIEPAHTMLDSDKSWGERLLAGAGVAGSLAGVKASYLPKPKIGGLPQPSNLTPEGAIPPNVGGGAVQNSRINPQTGETIIPGFEYRDGAWRPTSESLDPNFNGGQGDPMMAGSHNPEQIRTRDGVDTPVDMGLPNEALPSSLGPEAYAGPEKRGMARDISQDAMFQEYREKFARGEDLRTPEAVAALEQKNRGEALRQEAPPREPEFQPSTPAGWDDSISSSGDFVPEGGRESFDSFSRRKAREAAREVVDTPESLPEQVNPDTGEISNHYTIGADGSINWKPLFPKKRSQGLFNSLKGDSGTLDVDPILDMFHKRDKSVDKPKMMFERADMEGFNQRRQNMMDDTARMERDRLNRPFNQKEKDFQDDWDRSARNAALSEGRNINDIHTPPTHIQTLIRESQAKIRKFSDDYSEWFSEQENKLPEGKLFKPPKDIADAHAAEYSRLQDEHAALVKKLTGGPEKGRPPDIEAVFTEHPPDKPPGLQKLLEDRSPENANQTPRAEFAYDWPDFHEDGRSEPQYHIFGGPSHKSTVGAPELRTMGIDVPTSRVPYKKTGLESIRDEVTINREWGLPDDSPREFFGRESGDGKQFETPPPKVDPDDITDLLPTVREKMQEMKQTYGEDSEEFLEAAEGLRQIMASQQAKPVRDSRTGLQRLKEGTQKLLKGESGELDTDKLLPPSLRSAKPRFNMGNKQYQPNFASDMDKALFIIAQDNPSKSNAQYLKFVTDTLKVSEPEAIRLGKVVRAQIKAHLHNKEPGVVDVPKIHGGGDASRLSELVAKSKASSLTIKELAEARALHAKINKPPTPSSGAPAPSPFGSYQNYTKGQPQVSTGPTVPGNVPPPTPPIHTPPTPPPNIPPPTPPPPTGGPPPKSPGMFSNILNVSKTLKSTADFSIPLRQGLPLVHTKAYWSSFEPMFKAWGSKVASEKIQNDIINDPSGYFKPTIGKGGEPGPSFAEELGLDLTNNTTNREEAMLSTLMDKWLPLVARSNRAYSAFGNNVRSQYFKVLVDSAKKSGVGISTSNFHLKALADFVNNTTGRGSLGDLEPAAGVINGALFAPKLIAGTVRRLNPVNYIFQPKQVRQEYLKSMVASVTAWTAMVGMVKTAGEAGIIPDVEVSLDPTSSDFGKARIGKVRFDASGGLQPYIVALARMTPKWMGKEVGIKTGQFTNTEKQTTQFGKGFPTKNRWEIAENFMVNKASPPARFAHELLTAAKWKPFNTTDQTVRLFTPMIAEDAVELYRTDPELMWMLAPAAFGAGVQSFGRKNQNNETLFGYKEPYPIK